MLIYVYVSNLVAGKNLYTNEYVAIKLVSVFIFYQMSTRTKTIFSPSENHQKQKERWWSGTSSSAEQIEPSRL